MQTTESAGNAGKAIENATGRAHGLPQTRSTRAKSKNPVVATAPIPQRDDESSGAATWNDVRLVSECLGGNEEAWAALIAKYKRLIYSVPIKYGATAADAADIFQSVCLELFCELRNLRKAESLKVWLIVVTAHKCLQWKKQRQAETSLGIAAEEDHEVIAAPTPELVEEIEKEQMLREAVAQVAPRCRELIRLLFYEDPPLPYAQVAARLGLATGSIGFTRGRCLDRLQKILLQMGF